MIRVQLSTVFAAIFWMLAPGPVWAEETEIAGLFAGTKGGGQGGGGKVFHYIGNSQWTEISPDPVWDATDDVAAVMTLAFFNGHLYAGVQTSSGYGGGSGQGQVWRYGGERTWALVNPVPPSTVNHLDNSVMVLAVMNGKLYAGTTLVSPSRGRVYQCETCDGTDWVMVGESGQPDHSYGFRSGVVSSICGEPQLFLGELNRDDFWRYDTSNPLSQIDGQPGSCIWDFTEMGGRLYAGAWSGTTEGSPPGPVYESPQHPQCGASQVDFVSRYSTSVNNWALETFQDKLYVGGGAAAGAQGAKLWEFDGVDWSPRDPNWTRPTSLSGEGVTAFAVYQSQLFAGLGLPDGYTYSGDGRAEVWRSLNGTDFYLESPSDESGTGIFGGGVQCLVVGSTLINDCNFNGVDDAVDIATGTSTDCDDNDVPDDCQPDCNGDGPIDACTDDDDEDGTPDSEDHCICGPEYPVLDCYGNVIGIACSPVPVPHAIFDLDEDCDIDSVDYGILQVCRTDAWVGSPNPPPPYVELCRDTRDVTGDHEVTMAEVLVFDRCDSGPEMTADVYCGDCDLNGKHDAGQDFNGDLQPDGDFDLDGIEVRGMPLCTAGNTEQCDDNCPCSFNPDQEDTDADGIGDECAPPSPEPPPPPDADGDGVPDDGDNCPLLANADQTNSDADDLGNACDNCPQVDNAGQEDLDWDGMGDPCDDDCDGDGLANASDPCPDDPCTFDVDGDGIHDVCDPDLDGDGILEDGDGDGQKWYWVCVGGNTVNCDDNCGLDWNPDQEDWDSDGIGNACDPTPGEELLDGGMEMMTAGESFSVLTEGVTAYFVLHETGANNVDLPAIGGTVVVDLMVANGVPITAWLGYPAYSPAGGTPAPQEAVVSVDAEDWTAKADLLAWAGLSQDAPASRYDCDVMWWAVMNPDGVMVCQSWIKDAHGIERLAEPDMSAILGTSDLSAIHGPLSTPIADGFASENSIGGLTSRMLQPGYTRVATLTLNVAGQPGVYDLTIAAGEYFDGSEGMPQVPMDTGPAFEIRVGAE